MASKSAAMKKDIIKLPFTKTNFDSLCDLTLIKTAVLMQPVISSKFNPGLTQWPLEDGVGTSQPQLLACSKYRNYDIVKSTCIHWKERPFALSSPPSSQAFLLSISQSFFTYSSWTFYYDAFLRLVVVQQPSTCWSFYYLANIPCVVVL